MADERQRGGHEIVQSRVEESSIDLLKSHIDNAIRCSQTNQTQLPKSVFSLEGMSSRKNRILLNAICQVAALLPTRYLEIGVWKGSTFISANYGNPMEFSVAIDNWSEFGGPKTEFLRNGVNYLGNKFQFIDGDCFSSHTINRLKDHKFDIYFYDGNHSERNQYLAFKKYDHLLDDVFIAIVDDWSWPQVKSGTLKAFEELQYQIIKKFEIDTNQSDPHGYWNGLIVALIRKTNTKS